MRVALAKLHITPRLGGADPGDRQHLFTEIATRQPNVVWVCVEIEPRTDRDFKDVTAGLRAGPVARVAEEHAFYELHLAVISARLLVPVAMSPFGAVLCLSHVDPFSCRR